MINVINRIKSFNEKPDALGVGGGHTCVIHRITENLVCFGNNKDGQLEIGNLHFILDNENSKLDSKINFKTDIKIVIEKVSTGINFTCV
mmetsp:Transcript_27315/g.22965  ORF Transcript_27315/g.22965 Transcript_27315/m.22965 type:complete len:89 (+) Transcript_27315:265-531(+)